MLGGRREGSQRLVRGTRRREISGKSRPAARAGREDRERRARGVPAPHPPRCGASCPKAPPSLLTSRLCRPRRFPARELRLDHPGGVPPAEGGQDEGRLCTGRPRPECPSS